jgi:hypothetical protein
MSKREHPAELLVARHFDVEGRLTRMPVKRDRRLLVLAHLVEAVPHEVDLDEFAVNNLLRRFNHDVASIRRALVDEGFLTRPSPGVYRRVSTPNGE